MGYSNQLLLSIKGDTKLISEVMEFIDSEYSYFDFNNILPVPSIFKDEDDYKYDGTLKSILNQYKFQNLAIRLTGFSSKSTWMQHHRHEFSNAADAEIIKFGVIKFSLWNSFGIPVIARLSEIWPTLKFRLFYLGEDFGRDVGIIFFRNGQVFSHYTPNGFSPEGYGLSWCISRGILNLSHSQLIQKGNEVISDMQNA